MGLDLRHEQNTQGDVINFYHRSYGCLLFVCVGPGHPPQWWQHGIKHRMIIHIWEVHNYSKVSADHDDPNIAVGEPERRRLPWFWGIRDNN